MQGVQLIGRPEEGPGIEGAPQDLLDRVTRYLVQERSKLRVEAASSTAGESLHSVSRRMAVDGG